MFRKAAKEKKVYREWTGDEPDFDMKDVDAFEYNQDLQWFPIFYLIFIHVVGIYGLIVGLAKIKWSSFIFMFTYGVISGIGVTVGCHRFYVHRAFKANLPLRLLLVMMYASSGEWRLHTWVLEHRCHHKFTETIFDPVNAKRGFFYAHCGFLMRKYHPLCEKKLKTIDVSDLYKDPVAKYYDKYFYLIMPIFCFYFPTLMMRYYFGEPWVLAITTNIFRHLYVYTATWFVNSITHNNLIGTRPYMTSNGTTNHILCAFLSNGEGWHNFHHAFPWDYRSKELGFDVLAIPTHFINFFAKIGWAYDLKVTSEKHILRQAAKHGDGSRFVGGVPMEEVPYTE